MKKEDTLSELAERGAKVLEQLEPKRRKAIRMARRQAIEMESHPKESGRTTKVTVRMPEELVKALKHRAIDEGRTFQELVAEAVRRFLGQ